MNIDALDSNERQPFALIYKLMFGGERQKNDIAEREIRTFFSDYKLRRMYCSPILEKTSWQSPVEKMEWFENIQQPWVFFIDRMEHVNADHWKIRLKRIFNVVRKAKLSLTLIAAGTTAWKANLTPYLAEKMGTLEVCLPTPLN